jgi:hypothetical protein
MVMAFNPDDPHDGRASDELGITYRMIHIGPELMTGVLADVTGRSRFAIHRAFRSVYGMARRAVSGSGAAPHDGYRKQDALAAERASPLTRPLGQPEHAPLCAIPGLI